VRGLLETRYAEPHSLTALGRAVGVSPFHLARIFRELTGSPPHRYLLRVRLARGAELLRQGVSVTETSFRCGFPNPSHFIRSFRRAFGVTPSRIVPKKARKCKPGSTPSA
jgi:AraC-like DNA-binding protein